MHMLPQPLCHSLTVRHSLSLLVRLAVCLCVRLPVCLSTVCIAEGYHALYFVSNCPKLSLTLCNCADLMKISRRVETTLKSNITAELKKVKKLAGQVIEGPLVRTVETEIAELRQQQRVRALDMSYAREQIVIGVVDDADKKRIAMRVRLATAFGIALCDVTHLLLESVTSISAAGSCQGQKKGSQEAQAG